MGTDRKTVWTARELLEHEFPPIPWIVPSLITSGLTVIAGAPKLGKSWLVLAICYAVSVGGAVLSKIRVDPGKVLYVAYEDTARRLKSRLEKIGASPSETLTIATDWKRGREGLDWLRKWLEKNPDTRMIVIDTWARFAKLADYNDYGEAGDRAHEIKDLADEYDCAIVLVHHARKPMRGASDGDFLDSLLGSVGLTGSVDTPILLQRGRGKRDAVLHVTGRDVEEADYALVFDPNTGTWALEGTVAEVQESEARQEIYDLLADAEGSMTPKAVAEALGKNHSTVKNLLRRMAEDGAVEALSGHYRAQKPVDRVDPVDSRSTETTETTGPQGGEAGQEKSNEPEIF
ncbi:MAG: AAA family ATPase [bacterium]